ncbi:MAG: haloacid dehalogenase-like hydrolase [Planctomycetes bacterium]|nr:haloacid dehalogenase-like hydrolase [Planctomycetota bacterium]
MGSSRLREIFPRIDAALARDRLPICVFDLDSTLFSTAHRNLAILREFVDEHAAEHPHLADVAERIGLDDMGWNVHEDLRRFGFTETEILSRLKGFWFERFFRDEYLAHDVPVPGAVAFVHACHARGALIYYLTGRHVGGMEVGTVRSLREHGFPFWRGRCVLHLKPSFEMNDSTFKQEAIADLRSYHGEVVATFENEPGNANMFLRAFPGATHVLLETIHSPGAEEGSADLVRSPDFELR